MAKNYAVVLETNKTYNAAVHTEEDAEAAVKAATKKLHSDQDALIDAQMAVKEQKTSLLQKKLRQPRLPNRQLQLQQCLKQWQIPQAPVM